MLRGASAEAVEYALASDDPLPGTAGFAGDLPNALVVRDVLGREPLFYEESDETDGSDETGEIDGSDENDEADEGDGFSWSFDRTDLANPRSFPAGHVWDGKELIRAWSLPDPGPKPDEETAIARVRETIEASLDGIREQDLAVAFSGGVDSALVAAFTDAPLHVVGYEGSADLDAARESAELMDRDLTVHEVTLPEIEAAIPAVARAIGRTNAMDVQIALPLYLVAKRVREDGFDRLALGQGADELFGGYAKVANAPDDPRVEADTVRGARRETVLTLPDQLERDVLALRGAGVEPVTPLLHDRVVDAALRLPEDLLVRDGERKRALRLVASDYLPEAVAFREKKAVQYGTLVAREVDRLARRAGFKRRMDDHVRKYIESRI